MLENSLATTAPPIADVMMLVTPLIAYATSELTEMSN